MLNQNKTGLLIFQNFWTDHDLPKHHVTDANGKEGSVPMQSGRFEFPPMNIDGFDPDIDVFDQNINYRIKISKRMWKRIFLFCIGWILPKKAPKISVQDFFKNIKTSLKDVEAYQDKVNEFIRVANHAKKLGQKALFEEIMKDVEIVKLESLLLASGFKTCITEEQIVQFYKDSEKGLSLHFIRNFGRVIPSEVSTIKDQADELKVFDNYAVLYYDKDQKTYKETYEEREKRKDPILFGLISGSNKLYYIADWVDEYCDLTLKQLVDKFGSEAISANDITVKYHKS